MSVTATARVLLDVEIIEVIKDGIKAGNIHPRVLESLDLTNGTTDGSIDLVYGVTVTGAAASLTTVYDLAGTLTDAEGSTITFAEIALIVLRNRRTTALAYLIVGPDTSAGFGALSSSLGFWGAGVTAANGGGNVVAPSSFLCLYNAAGVPVAAGSTDELAVVTSGVASSDNSWDLILAGRSA